MKKYIALDIETTGINLIDKHYIGHKIIEIGAIEIKNRKITNNIFHHYINPKRKIEEKSFKIHGINNNFLKNKPIFKDICEDFIKFINKSILIIHNSYFDISFIENELKIIKYKIKKINKICKIIDTLPIARKIFPKKKNDLNSLCQRYNINITKRKKHGALLDAKLLAIVFINMTRKQNKINFLNKNKKLKILNKKKLITIYANKKEIENHFIFLNKIKKKYNKCIWLKNLNKK